MPSASAMSPTAPEEPGHPAVTPRGGVPRRAADALANIVIEVCFFLSSYALLFVILAIRMIYVRSSLVQLNPTLYLRGWRVASVELPESGWSGFVISRRRLRDGEPDRAVRLTDRLYIDYRRSRDHG
jgi:hypothetical protein